MHTNPDDAPERTTDSTTPPPAAMPSEVLLRGRSVVPILHKGERYLLRQTRLGKLILTK